MTMGTIETKEELIYILDKIKEGKGKEVVTILESGLCYNIGKRCSEELYLLFYDAMHSWPKMTDSEYYIIPAPEGYRSPIDTKTYYLSSVGLAQMVYEKTPGEDMYDINHPYGKLRCELAGWISDKVKETL